MKKKLIFVTVLFSLAVILVSGGFFVSGKIRKVKIRELVTE